MNYKEYLNENTKQLDEAPMDALKKAFKNKTKVRLTKSAMGDLGIPKDLRDTIKFTIKKIHPNLHIDLVHPKELPKGSEYWLTGLMGKDIDTSNLNESTEQLDEANTPVSIKNKLIKDLSQAIKDLAKTTTDQQEYDGDGASFVANQLSDVFNSVAKDGYASAVLYKAFKLKLK